jgi:flagellar hook assembly protein FlgD
MNFKINIFDLLGRRVNMIEKKEVSSGRIFINWDGKDLNGKQLGSGVYFAMPISSDQVEPIKFILLKE